MAVEPENKRVMQEATVQGAVLGLISEGCVAGRLDVMLHRPPGEGLVDLSD